MTAMALAPTQVERPACWCCGSTFAEQDLTRLGNHPEVGVCAGCAQWLHRRARSAVDASRRTPALVVRRGLDAARGRVMRAGAQDWPVLGAMLRGLDRRLP